MRLLIADDHTLFRDALATFIQRSEPESEVFTAKDLAEALDLLKKDSDIDLILLDLRMPGMDGLEGFKVLKQQYSDIAVVLMSGVAEREHIKAAMNLGAVGYFPKTLTAKALIKAIHLVLAGEIFMPLDPKTHDVMPSYFGDLPVPPKTNGHNSTISNDSDSPLTPREINVLEELLKGASNKDIARMLDLQVVTVKLHIRGICRKLGAKNRTHAALLAVEKGFIRDEGQTLHAGA